MAPCVIPNFSTDINFSCKINPQEKVKRCKIRIMGTLIIRPFLLIQLFGKFYLNNLLLSIENEALLCPILLPSNCQIYIKEHGTSDAISNNYSSDCFFCDLRAHSIERSFIGKNNYIYIKWGLLFERPITSSHFIIL